MKKETFSLKYSVPHTHYLINELLL